MEAFGKPRNFCGSMVPDLKAVGKKSLEWDLNDYKWDGHLFSATPLNSIPSDCRSRQLFPTRPETPSNAGWSNSSSGSDDISMGNEKGKRELEKRRRAAFVENGELNDEAGSLNLKLGGQVYPILEGDVKTGKKTKIIGNASSGAVCQVENCKADLSHAKDYHRRHKVCDMHSKATKAEVGNVLQRFCQQCSRFHVLQEFDEGKRSCRRRLAGHNRRRRKTHPETLVNGGTMNDERGSGYLLISLLRILSNMQSSSSDQTKDQDLLSHLLRNLGNLNGTVDGRNITALLQGSQGLLNGGVSNPIAQKVPNMVLNNSELSKPYVSTFKMDDRHHIEDRLRITGNCPVVPSSDNLSVDGDLGSQGLSSQQATTSILPRDCHPSKSVAPVHGRIQLNDIDLNNTYDDSRDYAENLGNSHVPGNPGTESLSRPFWIQQGSNKSLPQTSGNSDSTSTRSPSSSSGEAQSRTDRIVFKLFGKDPNDLPFGLRSQILDWLSHSPTDIESYIRPGCIILTIYLRLEKSKWEELCCHLGSSLVKLVNASEDPFWRTGWIYTRVQHFVAFMYNGQIVLDTPLPLLRSHRTCRISYIKPIAVSVSKSAQFVVKGFNLSRSNTRLLCALEGKYLAHETCDGLIEGSDITIDHDGLQSLRFSCSVPDVSGRGFIEVEDHGLSSSFFPFIVAEQEVCSEICMLEDVIEVAGSTDVQIESDVMEAKNQAMDFIHELGWLLHRSRVNLRLDRMDPELNLFPFGRFRLLMEFSMDHDWCAVVKKLLVIMFEGSVDGGDHPSIELALLNMGLLHKAVQRNCRAMVEFLLQFVPDKGSHKTELEQKQHVDKDSNSFLFKPDVAGPMGLTPLHIAASTDGCEYVLDALTDDPVKVGIKAWKNARDKTGLTPYDYACLQGRYSYLHIVQRKISKQESGHVVLDIPGIVLDKSTKQKQFDGHKSSKVASFDTEKIERKAIQGPCKLCYRNLAYRSTRSLLVYRPALLSMVAIAAVCVCVALLFKSSPEVVYVFQPFRWDLLKYGPS